jgi:hypothetical protein
MFWKWLMHLLLPHGMAFSHLPLAKEMGVREGFSRDGQFVGRKGS